MKKKQKPFQKPSILFNASVILAGIHNPSGGSGRLISYVHKGHICGVVSEIIIGEAIRHAKKVQKTPEEIHSIITRSFAIIQAPSFANVRSFQSHMIDLGDAHVFASYLESKCQFLVSLDKHHILALQGKIKSVTIVSPKELLEQLFAAP